MEKIKISVWCDNNVEIGIRVFTKSKLLLSTVILLRWNISLIVLYEVNCLAITRLNFTVSWIFYYVCHSDLMVVDNW